MFGATTTYPSVEGALLRGVTWFQAVATCANSGKQLCTNAEWQTAVSGTPDPGSFPDANSGDGCTGAASSSSCTTCAAGPGTAGQAQLCVSRFGAMDLVGNLWEWVADWYPAGRTAPATYTDATSVANWPTGYSGDNDDRTWNIDGRANSTGAYRDGLPAAGLRGGDWDTAAGAGAFTVGWYGAPSRVTTDIGLRCCRRGQ
ncbi:MAG: SUMF1/EgtB/PvdO family nonheme iron enzyme [Deltaproteobacteria bacterium]|nr:SUMF1/EgtB/PvdO family nonheme iron enzyme [Deltaproteobacteria bacterium]